MTDEDRMEGGIIRSEAPAANNHFITGSLTAENIENHSEISLQSLGGGISTDMFSGDMVGSLGKLGAANGWSAVVNALGGVNRDDKTLTRSAIGDNIKLEVKTGEIPTALSRDTEHSNAKVQRYDKAEYEERLEMAQVIGDISQNQIDIQWTPKVREAEATKAQAETVLQDKTATAEQQRQAQAELNQAETVIQQYGKGGDYQLAARAVTGVLQGLATGNPNAAWVNGLSPYANNLIKQYTTDEQGKVNTAANLMAHAILGALEAYATDNHAAAGAAGAVTAEAVAHLITEQLYHTDPDNLTDDQKQVVATLSQVTAGLAGVVVGDSTQSAVSAAEIGKRAAENNYNAVPFVENIDANSLKAMAEIQSEKIKLDDETKVLMEKEVMEQVDKYAPHYISIDGTFYKVTFKASINTRNGDVFLTSNLSPINMTSGSNISSMGLSLALTAGWYDLPADIRHKELQTAINNAMDGNGIGGNICFYACAGYSRTIPWAGIKHGINSYSVGVGAGINLSIGGEHTWKYSENSN